MRSTKQWLVFKSAAATVSDIYRYCELMLIAIWFEIGNDEFYN